jgi:hypothetical protein
LVTMAFMGIPMAIDNNLRVLLILLFLLMCVDYINLCMG